MVLGAEGKKREEEKLNLKVFMLTEMKSVLPETRKSHDTTNSPLIHILCNPIEYKMLFHV